MIKNLEMLLALAKEKHFGHAAERLGITQPSLSSGIKQLEAQLGVKLVQRGSRYGGLTPEGQRALVWARQIVGDSRRLRDEMRSVREGLSGHLRLAVIPTALTWAARLTTEFAQAHPNVSFTVLSRASTEILDLLENLDADAGISYLDNEPLGRVTSTPLYNEHFALVCRDDHPLAARSNVAWSELGGIELSLLTPDMQNRRILNRNFMEAGVEPHARIESGSTIVLVASVINGGRATILPEDHARFLAKGHPLSVVPIEETHGAPAVGVIAPFQDTRTPVLTALFRVAGRIATHESAQTTR
ncbi:LysR family transcriptional regulator [Lutimaribacter sp. EGI FJ00015]|uniref:LysR family transcriptional regulator n=1 Tax=Lutimaribacter degradans TaxID=2945989 RepID=A0ACC5ZZT5_9RHOB|nr:LysR family transcriptional regulator [Lutimaribacter sp. EGI FJ00013]MCM2563562.1 LysR family transcriptional regulator [Lutimaribacter sp. EGI FJ00013]MCO0614775.1 LysR family transcriptional regulator [Lutimaribacter sp. EGI FJ00015]MCO0637444.1 LysR family transcriptional regulator [Lutimaribacter sp. EGI FJ00014]